MKQPRIVIDTNVLVAALRSNKGASYKLVALLGSGWYEPAVSVPLVLEYEAVAKRFLKETRLTAKDIDAVIDYICSVACITHVSYLWRPFLKDADDDMILEAAVVAGCTHIVTFNVTDFGGAERFGITVMKPQAFLAAIGADS